MAHLEVSKVLDGRVPKGKTAQEHYEHVISSVGASIQEHASDFSKAITPLTTGLKFKVVIDSSQLVSVDFTVNTIVLEEK